MGLGSTVYVQIEEEKVKDQDDWNICREAAILVIKERDTRHEAMKMAKEEYYSQKEAENDITGAEAALENTQSPTSLSAKEEKQIEAVQTLLYESRESYGL